MSNNQYTFANMPSVKVLEMCEKSPGIIQKRVEENIEDHIAALMNRRFFRCKTREKAIEALKKDKDYFGFTKWDRISEPSWVGEALLRIRCIERLAKMSDTVSIGAADTDLF